MNLETAPTLAVTDQLASFNSVAYPLRRASGVARLGVRVRTPAQEGLRHSRGPLQEPMEHVGTFADAALAGAMPGTGTPSEASRSTSEPMPSTVHSRQPQASLRQNSTSSRPRCLRTAAPPTGMRGMYDLTPQASARFPPEEWRAWSEGPDPERTRAARTSARADGALGAVFILWRAQLARHLIQVPIARGVGRTTAIPCRPCVQAVRVAIGETIQSLPLGAAQVMALEAEVVKLVMCRFGRTGPGNRYAASNRGSTNHVRSSWRSTHR